MDSPLLPLVCVWLDNNFPKIGAKLRKRTNCTSTPEISLEDVFAKYALLLAQVRPKNGKKRKLPEKDGSQKVKSEPDRKKKRTKESTSTSKGSSDEDSSSEEEGKPYSVLDLEAEEGEPLSDEGADTEKEDDSSSSSSDTSSDDENTTKETPGKDDDSSSSSSSSDDDSDAGGDAKARAKKIIEGSDSDDSSSSEDEDVDNKKAAESDSDSGSSSSSSSSSDEDKDVKTKKKNKVTPGGSDSDDSSDDGDDKGPSSSSDDSSSDSDSDDESSDGEADKRKKKSQKAKAPEKTVQKPSKKPKRKRQKPNRPFQRVKAANVSFINDKLKDNTYNAAESFGRKASETLLRVKGKDFVKSKNKHKRKTYFGGGRIDMGVRSIKF